MCQRCYQVETDFPSCGPCMPARERIFRSAFLTFIARGLPSLQQIMQRVPSDCPFSHFSAEPSRSPLQGPQARPQTQSHGGPEEQAAAIWGGLVRGEGQGQGQRQRPGAGAGQEQDNDVRGSSACAHGDELSGRNRYVNRWRDGKTATARAGYL